MLSQVLPASYQEVVRFSTTFDKFRDIDFVVIVVKNESCIAKKMHVESKITNLIPLLNFEGMKLYEF